MYTFTDPARSAPKTSNVQTKEFDSDAFLSFLGDMLAEIDREIEKEPNVEKVKKATKATNPTTQVIYFNIINLKTN